MRMLGKNDGVAASWSGRRESNPRHTAWEAVVLPLNYARARARITRIWAGEKQAPQALWRCGVRALCLRRSPTAPASVAYACSHGLTERPPFRISTDRAALFH